jgi:hypothetical protein
VSFSERVAAIGGLILVAIALACFTLLALNHIIDGAAAVASMLGVLGLGGGTVVAAKAVTNSSNNNDNATPLRRSTDVR